MKPTPICTATVSVLNRIGFRELRGADLVAFSSLPDAPDEAPGKELVVPLWAWRDLGSPDQITVTVEPGDRLNA